MDPLDDTVRDALKALEGSATPRGYFDELPKQIEARMQQEVETHSESNAAVPKRVEDSGLHDIKELAKSQKTRISRRQTAQPDVADQILASSQSGLHAVALPDPAKMISLPSVEEARALARSATHPGMAAQPAVDADESAPRARVAVEPRHEKRGVPAWVWAGGGLLAAAAVVAFVVIPRGGTTEEPRAPGAAQDEAGKDQAAPEVVASTSTGSGSGAAQAPSVTAMPPPAPVAVDQGITTEGIVEDGDLAAQTAGADTAPSDSGESTDKGLRREAAKTEKSKERSKDKADTADKADVKTDKPIDKPIDKTKTDKTDKTTPPKDKKLDGAVINEGDSDELGIGDVMKGGGGKKDDKPSKTELTSKEMRDGLSKIEGKAKGCYDGTNGTVKVKLTIDPSGKVTKASASGALAGTPAGDCVVSAVKSASFPAWSGAPQSTTYVVLLSD